MRLRRSEALEEDLEAIKRWERSLFAARSRTEHVSDVIASAAASGPALIAHVVWFAGWIAINSGLMPNVAPFDPFPFPLLTTAVSLEAIFLALFVLSSQNRLSRQADQRSHLDLQIDLLAEREMTAVVQMVRDIARHLQVETSVTDDELRDLSQRTDLGGLTDRVKELSSDNAG